MKNGCKRIKGRLYASGTSNVLKMCPATPPTVTPCHDGSIVKKRRKGLLRRLNATHVPQQTLHSITVAAILSWSPRNDGSISAQRCKCIGRFLDGLHVAQPVLNCTAVATTAGAPGDNRTIGLYGGKSITCSLNLLDVLQLILHSGYTASRGIHTPCHDGSINQNGCIGGRIKRGRCNRLHVRLQEVLNCAAVTTICSMPVRDDRSISL